MSVLNLEQLRAADWKLETWPIIGHVESEHWAFLLALCQVKMGLHVALKGESVYQLIVQKVCEHVLAPQKACGSFSWGKKRHDGKQRRIIFEGGTWVRVHVPVCVCVCGKLAMKLLTKSSMSNFIFSCYLRSAWQSNKIIILQEN